MSMIYNFDKEFVKRTKDVLINCYKNTDYEVTLLLNCLLALVSLPMERKKVIVKENVDIKIIEFRKKCIDKLNNLKNNYKEEIFNSKDRYILNHIRNAIAHLHISLEESPYNGQIQNIILRDAEDIHKFKVQDYNFAINISVENLKEFAIYVSDEYINTFFNDSD